LTLWFLLAWPIEQGTLAKWLGTRGVLWQTFWLVPLGGAPPGEVRQCRAFGFAFRVPSRSVQERMSATLPFSVRHLIADLLFEEDKAKWWLSCLATLAPYRDFLKGTAYLHVALVGFRSNKRFAESLAHCLQCEYEHWGLQRYGIEHTGSSDSD
jgi:hypothetical protein